MNKLLPPDYNFFVQVVKLAKFLQPPMDKETGFIKERSRANQVHLVIDINTHHVRPTCHLTIKQFGSIQGQVSVPLDQSTPYPYRTWDDFFDQTEHLLYEAFKGTQVKMIVHRDGDNPREPRKEPVSLNG